MSRLRSHLLRSACVASAAVATIAGVGTAGAAPTFDLPGLGSSSGVGGTTYAVIGDVPYGAAQIATFPRWVDQINADPAVSFTFHLGDIKNGSSVCSDAYFGQIRTQFDRFRKPFIYTPWTGIGKTAATPEQLAEEKQRIGAAISLVRSTFAQARQRNQRAVAFYTQADMFDPTYDVTQSDDSAFTPLVRALA